tara:strand:- start:410 stop:1525 length:1116 start_codon:yes stop_codon:yes gene_type:complete
MSENNIDTVNNNNNNNTTKTKLSEEELLKKIEETQRSAEEIVKRFVQKHDSVSGDVKIENLNLNWVHHSGALLFAFGTSKILVNPLERFRLLMQVQPDINPTLDRKHKIRGWNHLAKMQKDIGTVGLMRGTTANILRSVPLCFIPFASYDAYKQLLYVPGVTRNDVNFGTRLLFGGISSLFFLGLTYPIDYVRTRIACDSYRQETNFIYANSAACARQTIKANGWKGLFSGIVPAALWTIPYYTIAFTSYDSLKFKFNTGAGNENNSLLTNMFCGGIAAAYAEAIAFPLDTIQRRIIINGMTPMYKSQPALISKTINGPFGLTAIAHSIWVQEGVLGFYRGLLPNMARSFFQMGCMFMMYENCKEILISIV